MRTLILMRHAKSDWKVPGLTDHDRPLNRRGQKAAPRMAEELVRAEISVDVILASTAVRVQETLAAMTPIWGAEAAVLTQKSLYLAPPHEIAKQVAGLRDSWMSAMVLAHNPGIGAMACHLSGQELEMPTGCVACFESEASSWNSAIYNSEWTLKAYWKPRDLEG